MIYQLTIDRPTNSELLLNNSLLELSYFDSNTQETVKKQLYSSGSSNCPPLNWRNPAKALTVTQAFICISYVYNAQKRRYTV